MSITGVSAITSHNAFVRSHAMIGMLDALPLRDLMQLGQLWRAECDRVGSDHAVLWTTSVAQSRSLTIEGITARNRVGMARGNQRVQMSGTKERTCITNGDHQILPDAQA